MPCLIHVPCTLHTMSHYNPLVPQIMPPTLIIMQIVLTTRGRCVTSVLCWIWAESELRCVTIRDRRTRVESPASLSTFTPTICSAVLQPDRRTRPLAPSRASQSLSPAHPLLPHPGSMTNSCSFSSYSVCRVPLSQGFALRPARFPSLPRSLLALNAVRRAGKPFGLSPICLSSILGVTLFVPTP